MVFGFLAIGCLLFLVGSEAVLRGGAGLLKAFGLPSTFVAFLNGSLALSAPVFAVALQATLHGAPDIALGDVLGSNITIILLVCGLGALLGSMPASPRIVFRDGGTMIAASLVLTAIMLGGFIPRFVGAILLIGWIAYLALAYITDWRRPPPCTAVEARVHTRGQNYGVGVGLFLLVLGIVCLFFGARFAVDGGLIIARDFHLSPSTIALTLLAFSTALPALATTLAAAVRGHTSLATGQLIASAIFNLLLVMGVVLIVSPLSVGPLFADFGAPVMAGCAVVLVALLASGWRLTRGQGALLLAGYAAFLFWVALRSGLIAHG